MEISYLLGGIVCLVIGFYFTYTKVTKYIKHEEDDLGFDSKGIAAGLGLLMIGIYLIAKFF